jgi:hypothetical protein
MKPDFCRIGQKNLPVSTTPTVLDKIVVDVPYLMLSLMPQYLLDGEVVVIGLPYNENR